MGLISRKLKSQLVAAERRYHVWRGVRRLRRDLAANHISEEAVAEIWLGWGNPDWSASQPLALHVARELLARKVDVVELGSGLTTLILGVVADHLRTRVLSIDHDRHWGERITRVLRSHQVESVNVIHAPLKDYGEYDWYELPPTVEPSVFGIVVVDGPPGATRGGRRGVNQLLIPHIPSCALVFVDDVGRPAEKELAEQISSHREGTLRICGLGTGHEYAVVDMGPSLSGA